MSDLEVELERFGRKRLLALLGGAGATGLWMLTGRPVLAVAAAHTSSAADACVPLTPEVTAGPYYIVNSITRRNISDGQKGLPLQLRLTVEAFPSCKPIGGANVEVWHANALGVYSGYPAGGSPGPGSAGPGGHVQPTGSARFLRGHQVSDSNGLVIFDTIYPGWYQGRAPHIHVKVHVAGKTVHTGQLFFNDVLSDAVYRTADYKAHGQPDTSDAQDSIYQQEGGTRAVLRIAKHPTTSGYVGTLTMAIRE